MTGADVQDWLDRYVAAWASYDEADIGDLFSDDVSYRYHAGDDPVVGRAAVVADWLNPGGDPASRDARGSWRAEYRPFMVDSDRAVACGWTDYDATADTPARVYDNCWLLEFDRDGRCRSFVEYYNLRRAPG